MKPFKLFVLYMAIAIYFVACFETITPTEIQPKTVDTTYNLPIFKPVDPNSLSQVKGGIRLTLASVDYKVRPITLFKEEEAVPPLISIQPKGATRYVKITEYQVLEYEPSNIIFKLMINNTLSRVFKGQGSVVQINWGQKLLETNYSELSNLILTPGQQTEISIVGPRVKDWLSMTSTNNNLGVYVYDVVTQIDQAGNIKEKQNFEWYFKVDFDKRVASLAEPKISYTWK